MQWPRPGPSVDPGFPSRREKARKVNYIGKLHLFTRRDIRANLPLNAALRAVLTYNRSFGVDLFICVHATISKEQINFISTIFDQLHFLCER